MSSRSHLGSGLQALLLVREGLIETHGCIETHRPLRRVECAHTLGHHASATAAICIDYISLGLGVTHIGLADVRSSLLLTLLLSF